MANHWKFECPNRKIGAAKDKLSTFFIDNAQVNNSVSGQYQSSEQVNIKSGQSDSWSNNQGKNVNIDLLSNVSSKDEKYAVARWKVERVRKSMDGGWS